MSGESATANVRRRARLETDGLRAGDGFDHRLGDLVLADHRIVGAMLEEMRGLLLRMRASDDLELRIGLAPKIDAMPPSNASGIATSRQRAAGQICSGQHIPVARIAGDGLDATLLQRRQRIGFGVDDQ